MKPSGGQGTVPKGWRLVRLGDVAALRNTYVTPSKTDTRPYIALEHIEAGGSLIDQAEARHAISNKTEFRSGDTLYGKLRPNLRKVVRIKFDGVCSTDILAIHGKENVNRHFLSHMVRSDLLHGHAMRGIAGTKMPRTSWGHLQKYRFACPPLPEQRAIAAVLDSIDDAIEGTDAVIAATEQLRDSLLHELLTRGVPGWHTEWKEAPGLGTIPAGWEVVRLGEVAEVNPRRPRLTVAADTSVTFLPMSAIAENAQGIIARELRPYADVSTGYTYFEEDDLLFSKITPCLQNGKHTLATGLEGGFGFGTTEFHVVRANAGLTASYLFRVLTQTHIIERCAKSFTGTAGQQRIQPETLKDLPFSLPPIPEQQAIAGLLDGVDAKLEQDRNQTNALRSLKESTADALLTGRVRV